MSRFQMKLLAAATMLTDHIGAILLPKIVLLRIIGRLSFPIFAFLICDGMGRTKNSRAYFLRLAAFALLSEIPYDLAFYGVPFYPQRQNIFFTLLLGLAGILILQARYARSPAAAAAGAFAAVLLGEVLHTDYGWFGVAAVILFYLLQHYQAKGAFAFAVLNTAFSLLTSRVQLFGAAAGVPIYFYSGKTGRFRWKYFFYFFYPLHLLALYFVHLVVF